MIEVQWPVFKQYVDTKRLSIQELSEFGRYYLYANDGAFSVSCIIPSDVPSTDRTEYETGYQGKANVPLTRLDSDGANVVRIKAARSGWTYGCVPLEFTTSSLASSLFSQLPDGAPRSGISLKLYNELGSEITTPDSLSTATTTVVDFEPTYDYELIGGSVRTATPIAVDMRLWIVAVPDIPGGSGGSKEMAGGINLRYLSPDNLYQVDGRVSKLLSYNAVYHTNKLRFILKYPAGTSESLALNIELYRL